MRPRELICPLCNRMIVRGDGALRGIEQFILDQHPALSHCQAALVHQHCFQTWEHRRLYVRLYNQHQKAIETPNFSIRMKANGALGSYDYHRKISRKRR